MNPIKFLWALRGVAYKFRFAKFGMLSFIGKPLILDGTKRVEIGNRVRIYPGARIETHGDAGRIIIEDNVSIGQGLHIASGEISLIVGKNTTISGNVLITNIDHDYTEIGVHILKQKHLIKETKIGENCFIGYGAVIQAGTILGKQCIVGSNSVVKGNFPDYCVIAGVPARIIKKYNSLSEKWERIEKNEVNPL